MPLPGTPHPNMVIQPLTFVALSLAKIWAEHELHQLIGEGHHEGRAKQYGCRERPERVFERTFGGGMFTPDGGILGDRHDRFRSDVR